jgi:hypothetical protein
MAILTLHHAVYTDIGVDERCIRNKFLASYQASLNPFINEVLKDSLESLFAKTLADSGQRLVVRNLITEIKLAEPAVCQIQTDFFAEFSMKFYSLQIANELHSKEQCGVD